MYNYDQSLIQSLPFTLDDYILKTEKSTFLDIGSGFGKPNFHVALQVYPKESLGIEVVPARVFFCQDQQCEFENQYQKKQHSFNQQNKNKKQKKFQFGDHEDEQMETDGIESTP